MINIRKYVYICQTELPNKRNTKETRMKKAIQFGAGNIGRGFIGAVLEQAGYHVVYADINQQIIDEINEKKKYPVHIMDTKSYDQTITNISAVNSASDSVVEEMLDATIITTAVGLGILPHIAPTIAKALKERIRKKVYTSLNIIACENGIRATSFLKEHIYKNLNEEEIEWCKQHIGFPDCSVDRIVPPLHVDGIDVVVEDYYEWNVEKKAIVGDLPSIPGMVLVNNLMESIERKLFTLNTGHAITAYLGLLKGYKTIDKSIQDEEILKTVRGAMQESGLALISKYGLDKDQHFKYIEKIINRFNNPFLKDDLNRVGRDPLRKLSKDDRLIRPLMTAREYGINTQNIEKGIAAALLYDNPDDPQSIKLQNSIREKGIEKTLSEVADIDINDPVLKEVYHIYTDLSHETIKN